MGLAHEDLFADKHAARDGTRAGLASMKVKIMAQADEIRATRTKNGLEDGLP